MFEKEQQRIKEIALIIREGKEHKIEKNFFLINWIFSRLIYGIGSPRIPTADKKYWVNNKCNSCGIC